MLMEFNDKDDQIINLGEVRRAKKIDDADATIKLVMRDGSELHLRYRSYEDRDDEYERLKQRIERGGL